MKQYPPGVRIWVGTVVAAAAAVSAIALLGGRVAPIHWLAVALLALCAGISHVYPVRSAYDGASYRMTSTFMITGAMILPPALLSLLAALSVSPDLWLRRRHPRFIVGWLFNAAQSVLAAHLTGAWIRWAGVGQPAGLQDLLAMVLAAVLFILTQNTLVGVVVALDARIPLYRVSTFSKSALLGEGLFGTLAVMAAGLWRASPVLLLIVPLLLLIAHRLTRTAHLAQMAEMDQKTGLYNCRHFEQVAGEELVRSRRTGRPVAILFADIDYLRQINNRYGHLAGDQVLLEVAGALKGALRVGDLVARFGGEEFVALLPGADWEQAGRYAEGARRAVEEHVIQLPGGGRIRCTISIGVAMYPEDGADLSALTQQADMAMYRAKHTRNAVVRLQPAPDREACHTAPTRPEPAARPGAPAGARPEPHPLAAAALWTTVAAGSAAILWGALTIPASELWLLAVFMALAMASEFLKVKVYEVDQQQITLTFGIVMAMAAAAVLPAMAPLIMLGASVVHVLRVRQRRLDKILFNITNHPLAAGAAAWAYMWLHPGGTVFTWGHLLAGSVAVLVYYLLNVGAIAVMISLHTRRPFWKVAAEATWFGPINLILGLMGAIAGGAHAQLGVVGITVFAVPLLTFRYILAQASSRNEQTLALVKEMAHLETKETLRDLIETVASIIDTRDNTVYGHSQHVAKYAVALGKELGLPQADLEKIKTAGLLHDLGKLGVPEAILNKPGRLTAEEYELVKQHAAIGEQILTGVRQLGDIARMVGEHHERWDGGGYPGGKRGHEITLGGRILAVADTLDCLLTDRPYATGKSLEWALREVDRCSGSQFDPDVVAALHRVVQVMGPEFFGKPVPQTDYPQAVTG